MGRCEQHQRKPFGGGIGPSKNAAPAAVLPSAEHKPSTHGTYKRFDSLYKTEKWRALRLSHLSAFPLCVVCGERADTVDHIVPHRGDARLFFNRGNLQSMCHRDHARKTAREVQQRVAARNGNA